MKEDQDDWYVHIHNNLYNKNTNISFYDINQHQYDPYYDNIDSNCDSNINTTTDIDTNWNDLTQCMHLPRDNYADQIHYAQYHSQIKPATELRKLFLASHFFFISIHYTHKVRQHAVSLGEAPSAEFMLRDIYDIHSKDLPGHEGDLFYDTVDYHFPYPLYKYNNGSPNGYCTLSKVLK